MMCMYIAHTHVYPSAVNERNVQFLVQQPIINMTDSYVNLSDVEIQRKLTQLGFPKTPVTETTRPLLIKKLMKHMKNEKLKKGKVTNYVLYSKDNNKPQVHNSPPIELQEYSNLFDNGLENNNDIRAYKNPTVLYKNDVNVNSVQSSASRMYAPPPVMALNYDDNEQHALNIANKFRKPRSTIPCGTSSSSTSYAKINGKPNICDGGVVNRLLSFRDTSTKKKKFNSKDGYSTVPMSNAFIKNGLIQKLVAFDLKSFLKKPDISLHIIPHVLIASFVIFLAMISVLYVAKKFYLSPISRTDLRYTICGPNDKDLLFSSPTTVTCISEDLFKKAVYISEELFKYLNERARLHHCIDKEHSPTLELDDLKKALSENSNVLKGNTQKKLLATQYLIGQNPQWMIKTIVSTLNSSDDISFELTEPNLPIKCIIQKKMSRFFTAIGLLLLVALVCLIVYLSVAFYRIRQKEKLLAAEHFIKDIINELMYQSSVSENSEVIINELQDKLLPAHKRSKLLNSWNKALKTLEGNDNRVLFGMIARNGEQLRTMTWNKNLGNKEVSTSKKWQSSAFDNSNKILNPPTSCLKIRHMFDQSEVEQPNLRQMIVESIFEKVGSNCKICDVQLDKQSCCVYIRCATEADAGMVHNEINGWWFDKKLISIKFLRLERYLSRFPKSLAEPIYFKSPNIN
ncbi:inner nuclear membrane protein Man1 isoform X1 [Drosophila albomicans]|uniref:Inner nuclear membrane protein Man1 isoform X1 n=2 Tax=Drosophila albomicans TaxID=7291 RepID=A0A6P8XDC5_DROAB|nr:inner nuclear membrane protein Man1 isoform X1 [Drosophila albomicans]